jgi:selenocysteine lyase/cysteine desulfurase
MRDAFASLRQQEYARLDKTGEAYLDFTGSALYPESVIEKHAERLRSHVFGNPHSENGPSRASTESINEARARVLAFLDADEQEYTVCFTANTSGAIKLVAESYDFGPRAPLVLAADNHNSMNGIRRFAERAGARAAYLPLDDGLRLCDAEDHLQRGACGAGLFGFPAQSNFSGVRHPLELVSVAQELGYEVLLDAAAFLPTSPLSLTDTPADFVVFSAYKILGFPTGVGALVAGRKALDRLRRPWFAGGTVEYASVQLGSHLMRAGAEGFEDGTPAFLDIAALADGLEYMSAVGRDCIASHVSRVTGYALARMRSLENRRGEPLVELYGPQGNEGRGGTIAFNVRTPNRSTIPFGQVVERARNAGVSMRGGCFCNPGAAERALGLPADAMATCLSAARHGDFSLDELSRCLGPEIPVGAVRVSFGIPTTRGDVDRAVEVIATYA